MSTSNTKMRRAVITLSCLGMMLSACGGNGRLEDPVISKQLAPGVTTLSTKAERRLVISSNSPSTKLRVCAEPSPDALESIFSGLRVSAGAKGSAKSVTDAEAQAEVIRTVATSVAGYTRRSQGLQFFRDGTYALCQGAMSGLADQKIILGQFNALRADAVRLILKEISHEGWYDPVNVKVEAPTAAGDPLTPAPAPAPDAG